MGNQAYSNLLHHAKGHEHLALAHTFLLTSTVLQTEQYQDSN